MLEKLFGKTQEPTPSENIANLLGESNAILGLVTHTITDLRNVNEKISEQKDALSDEINKLVARRDQAGMQVQENETVATNLESLFKA